jgi:hypothetical protein
MLRDTQLRDAIATVGRALKGYDASDPRLPWLRKYYEAAADGGTPPKDATPELVAEWLRILRLVPDGLPARAAGDGCPRCQVGAGLHTGPVVEGYGFRVACVNCGEAWVVLTR